MNLPHAVTITMPEKTSLKDRGGNFVIFRTSYNDGG